MINPPSTALGLLTLQTRHGFSICVPKDLSCITTYVVLEQERWFEDEMDIIPRLLAPGDTVIDVGASYGFYSVAMSRAVGSAGQIWSFEPARDVIEHLQQTLADNGCGNVHLHAAAVSNFDGAGSLTDELSSELRGLSTNEGSGRQVAVVQLDTIWRERGRPAVSFVKIDAEGADDKVVAGAWELLRSQAPIVMCETPPLGKPHNAVEKLGALGFHLCRYLPSLDALVPLRPEDNDGRACNVLAIPPARVAELHQRGLLVLPDNGQRKPSWWMRKAIDLSQVARRSSTLKGLACWENATQPALSARDRYRSFLEARSLMESVASRDATLPLLCNLARVYWDLALRNEMLPVICQVGTEIVFNRRIPKPPFASPNPRFDTLRKGVADTGEWLLPAVLEQTTHASYSGYFWHSPFLNLMDAVTNNRFYSAEMERRRQLVRIILKNQDHLIPTALVAKNSPEHLNARVWQDWDNA
ncbi:MAG: FkbM family methyltransferase [Rhodospirillales bacterium]|nr:FkbM family methyltransferase [Rhodospirillales bacterium]